MILMVKKCMQTPSPPNFLSRLCSLWTVDLIADKVNVCHLLCHFLPPLILYSFCSC